MNTLHPLVAGQIRRIAWALSFLLFFHAIQPVTVSAAPPEKDDTVELLRDEPLLFKEARHRTGRKGERLTVLQYRAEGRRIYVLGKGTDGKPVALNLPEDAVRVIPRDSVRILDGAIELLGRSDFPAARARFAEAATAQPELPACRDLARISDALQGGLRELNALEANGPRVEAEVQRLRRNATVTDRPNPFKPGDTSNAERAQEIRRQADELRSKYEEDTQRVGDRLQAQLRDGRQQVVVLSNAGALSQALKLNTALLAVAGNARLSASRNEEGLDFSERLRNIRRLDLEATEHLGNAQIFLGEKRLTEAGAEILKGLQKEALHPDLRELELSVRKKLLSVEPILGEARGLKAKKDFEGALAKLKLAEAICIDMRAVTAEVQNLTQLIEERASSIATAKAAEAAGDFDAAMAVYEQYGPDSEVSRLLPALAKSFEQKGNWLSAKQFYLRAGLGEEARRIQEQAKAQADDYLKAAMAIVEGKYAEALALYEKYRDARARQDVLVAQAENLEAERKYEEALVVWRSAEVPIEVARLQSFIRERNDRISKARNMEAARNLEMARQLYEESGMAEDYRRVSAGLAAEYQERKKYEEAAECFEDAGKYEEAARIRKEHPVEYQISRRGLSSEEIAKRCKPACVTLLTTDRGSSGSGFFVARGGWILTNRHVVGSDKLMLVRLSNKRTTTAKVVAVSATRDLALLHSEVEEYDHKVLPMADSDKVAQAAEIYAIGSPGGKSGIYEFSITQGIVSSVEREYDGNPVFQISAAINHGNSGGPLIDRFGRCVGVNTFGEGTSELSALGTRVGSDIQNVNFAIKINEAKSLLSKINR